jgi:hypothetical protein
MTNFIAFDFCDNDFHMPLKQGIQYIVDHQDIEDPLTLASWREFAIRGLTAFDLLRRVDNWEAKRERSDHSKYFEQMLTVSEVTKLDDLRNGFEGYVYDKHTHNVFYHGY